MTPLLRGLADIAGGYDGFLVDLWGVVHNGVRPYARALECLQRLTDKPVLLLSNAPRRADSVRGTLRRLGISDHLYSHILTSGEATWMALRDRQDLWFASLGRRVYHLGPIRDRGVITDVELSLADSPANADFLLNTGPDDQRDTAAIEEFIPELNSCLHAGLRMICANPDLEIVRGDQRILCAGALAAWYHDNGGEVRWIGKPDPAIYDQALRMLGVPRHRVLAIGDSLRTDIAGAVAASVDSVWVLGGIHEAELGDDPAAAAREAGLAPKAMIASLAW